MFKNTRAHLAIGITITAAAARNRSTKESELIVCDRKQNQRRVQNSVQFEYKLVN